MDPEILEYIKSEAGAAAMQSPQDDEDGKKAITIMAKVNALSSEDMIEHGQVLDGQAVIELGPGAGYATKFLLTNHKPAAVYAFEVSPVFRSMLGEDATVAAAISAGTLVLSGDDAVSMPEIASSSVDIIFGMNVIYFLSPLEVYLREMFRVLKPGGRIVFGAKMGAAKFGAPTSFVNTDIASIVAHMTSAGFTAAEAEAPRLASTPAMYIPISCQKPVA
jgi:SAM-dependent methyltransferase